MIDKQKTYKIQVNGHRKENVRKNHKQTIIFHKNKICAMIWHTSAAY